MDIEKLIEQLKSAAGGPEGIKMCHAAATAPPRSRLKMPSYGPSWSR